VRTFLVLASVLLGIADAYASQWETAHKVSKIDGLETVTITKRLAYPDALLVVVCSGNTAPSVGLRLFKGVPFGVGAVQGAHRIEEGKPAYPTWTGRGDEAVLTGPEARALLSQFDRQAFLFIRIGAFESDLAIEGFPSGDPNVKRICGL